MDTEIYILTMTLINTCLCGFRVTGTRVGNNKAGNTIR